MSDKPMTAEKIRVWLDRAVLHEPSTSDARAMLGALFDVLAYLSARERELAELRERVERLEAKVMGDGR